MSKFITKTAFKKYLKSASLRKETYECTFHSCPIAKATGYSVSHEKYSPNKYPSYIGAITPEKYDADCAEWNKNALRLPEWAEKFIDIFDDAHVNDESLGAEMAQYILNNMDKIEKGDLIDRIYVKFGRRF
jgi:hypothetical protein